MAEMNETRAGGSNRQMAEESETKENRAASPAAVGAGGSDRRMAEANETKENLAASRAAMGDVAGDDGDGVEREVSTSGCSCGSHAAGSWAEDALRTGNATTRLPKEDDDLGLTEARDGREISEIEDGKLSKGDGDLGPTEAGDGKAIGEIVDGKLPKKDEGGDLTQASGGMAMERPDRE